MTDDLIAWLRAQLDEDELAARETSSTSWIARQQRPDRAVWCVQGNRGLNGLPALGVEHREDAEHIARHDPARVLAEVDAKRRILDGHAMDTHWCPMGDGILRVLALPYADRAGYRSEWAVTE